MNIAIWGTGSFGQYIAQQLVKKENCTVTFFIDSNRDLHGKAIEGIQVISPEELEDRYAVEVDILLVAFTNCISAYGDIVKVSGNKCGFIRNRVFEARLSLAEDILKDPNILWSDAEYLNKPMLYSLETNIEDGCNLNCRGCSHFSNLFERGEKVAFDTFCRDLKRISENVFIYQFNMLGGEILLNNQIVEYMEYAVELMPHTDIELITNGLLIPKQSKSFFECCKKYDIMIGISTYKPTLAMRDDIVRILNENEVAYVFRNAVEDFGKNIDLSGQNDRQIAVKRCRENRCHFMRQGKIYKCPFEALGNKFFSHFNIDAMIEGGIDIYKEGLDWQQVVNVLHNDPVDACKYCGVEERIEWRVASPPVIEDWII